MNHWNQNREEKTHTHTHRHTHTHTLTHTHEHAIRKIKQVNDGDYHRWVYSFFSSFFSTFFKNLHKKADKLPQTRIYTNNTGGSIIAGGLGGSTCLFIGLVTMEPMSYAIVVVKRVKPWTCEKKYRHWHSIFCFCFLVDTRSYWLLLVKVEWGAGGGRCGGGGSVCVCVIWLSFAHQFFQNTQKVPDFTYH